MAASASRAGGRRKEERKGELEWGGPRVGRDREGRGKGGHFPFTCHAGQLRCRATPAIVVKMYRFSLSAAKIVAPILNLLSKEWPSVTIRDENGTDIFRPYSKPNPFGGVESCPYPNIQIAYL